MYVYQVCVLHQRGSEEGVRSVEVLDGFEMPCECLELKPGSFQKSTILITIETSLQPPHVGI